MEINLRLLFLCGGGDGTQGQTHAKQVLYCCATSPDPTIGPQATVLYYPMYCFVMSLRFSQLGE